ncbi:MAG: hypothetical protein AAF630_00715, partial [Cyanobacteria bacterium P01_C01_bin.38]
MSEILPTNIPAEISTTQISLKLGRLKSKTSLPLLQSKSQTSLLYAKLLTKLLNIDWSNKKTQSTLNKSSIASLISKNKAQSRFCSAAKQISIGQDSVKKSQILAVVPVTKSKIKKQESMPNTILQSLQNVFTFPNPTQRISSSNSIPVALVRRVKNKYE